MATVDEITALIKNCPLLDSHAHPVAPISENSSYIASLTEADGAAVNDSIYSIHFKRSLREIAAILGTEASVDSILKLRQELGLESVTRRFFEASNTAAVLIDDGLHTEGGLPLDWHRSFVPFVGRVLRLEAIAETILNEGSITTAEEFESAFLSAIDPIPEHVVSFKSIIAYRSGLNVDPNASIADAKAGLSNYFGLSGPVRLTDPRILNFIFVKGLEVATKHGIPFQIHTGFGDKDLDLLLANPLHLRPILEDGRFSSSKIVLLHTSYPYSRQAGYLASVYSQVFVDIGLVLPKISSQGMQAVLHQLLELSPVNKLTYSSDAVILPELYYLGAKWARSSLSRVLQDLVRDGDLEIQDAKSAAVDILYNNANRLYNVSLPPVHYSTLLPGLETVQPPLSSSWQVKPRSKAVRLLFVDNAGFRKCRVVPTERFDRVVASQGVGLAPVCLGFPSFNTVPAPGCGLNVVGDVRLIPDLSTRRVVPWFPEHEIVMANMHATPGIPWEYCPRLTLVRLVKQLEEEFGLVMRAGFESEFYLLQTKDISQLPVPIDQSGYCAADSLDASASIIQKMVDSIEGLGVKVEQFHAEGGRGQFEVSYEHQPAVRAADSVLFVREAVVGIAQQHNLRATFLPQVFNWEAANGCHVHISINRNGKNVFGEAGAQYGISEEGTHWMAGVLGHLPAIIALSAPIPNSYVRLQPNMWSGAYQCWGQENKEAALRANSPPGVDAGFVSNFELKSCDAVANPYTVLSAIMAAGMDGLRKNTKLPDPLNANPAEDTSGRIKRLPSTLEEATKAFLEDAIIRDALGEKYSSCIASIRQAEFEHYKARDFRQDLPRLLWKY